MEFIDTHAHIYRKQFNYDRDEVVKRAVEANVTKIFQANLNLQSVEPMLQLCNKFPDVCLPMIGIHPKHIDENYNEEIEKIEDLLQKHKFYAIGEVGLDYYWAKRLKKLENIKFQKEAFAKFIKLASKYDLPLNIHSRSATPDTFEILEKNLKSNNTGIWHSLNIHHKPKKLIHWGIKLGIGGMAFIAPITSDAIKKVGITNIVLETDAPFLAPKPIKKENSRNESKNIPIIAKHIAEVLNIDISEVAEKTTKTAKEIYKIT